MQFKSMYESVCTHKSCMLLHVCVCDDVCAFCIVDVCERDCTWVLH